MSTLDIVIMGTLGIGIYRGFKVGFVKEASRALGLFLGFIIASFGMKSFGLKLANSLGFSTDLAPIIGFMVLFIIVTVIVYLIARFVEGVLGGEDSFLNKSFGACFGAIKTVLLLGIAFLIAGHFGLPRQSTKNASTLYEPVGMAVPIVWNMTAAYWPQIERITNKFAANEELALPVLDPAGAVREGLGSAKNELRNSILEVRSKVQDARGN